MSWTRDITPVYSPSHFTTLFTEPTSVKTPFQNKSPTQTTHLKQELEINPQQ